MYEPGSTRLIGVGNAYRRDDGVGLDPLYVANEGRFLAVVAPEDAARTVEALRGHVDMFSGEQLPRIC